jgi:hypothetical protein
VGVVAAGFDIHRAQITFDALDTDAAEITTGRIAISDSRPWWPATGLQLGRRSALVHRARLALGGFLPPASERTGSDLAQPVSSR